MDNNNFFEIIVENSMEIIIVFDALGKIVYGNKSAMLSLEYGQDIREYTIDNLFPGGVFLCKNESGVSWNIPDSLVDTVIYRKNRTCFPVGVKFAKHEGDRYVCFAVDLSEKVILEKKISATEVEAKQALKIKSEFVSNITHELKTPVNGIIGNTSALMERENDPEKLKLLGLVERGCRDMQTIIGNVLDFSKLEAGKFVLEPRKFAFRDMIDYVKSNHIHKINEKGLDFFVDVAPEVPEYIISDELRITQILNNLISNAIKFTHVGKIMVEVTKTAQFKNRVELFFFVIDSGIGISQADQDKLFKSFSQVDASISRQYGGTGLGLNICKQLVQLMGGNINVESSKDSGSMFSFNIWCELPDEEAAVKTEGENSESAFLRMRDMKNSIAGKDAIEYGSEANLEEIRKKMSKLVLCIEMDNWEKAEGFAESIKILTKEASKEIKTAVLKLKMSIQKEDYTNAMDAYDNLKRYFGM